MTRTRVRSRAPCAERVLIGLLLLEGTLALAGGLMLTARPSGALLQMPVQWLQGTPFATYLIPALASGPHLRP